MCKAALFICLIFLSCILFPAKTSDSLEKQIQDPLLPIEKKFEILTQLVLFHQDRNPVKVVEYGKKALTLLDPYGNSQIEVQLLLALTWATQNIGEYDTALEYGLRAEKLASQIGDKKSTAVAYNHISRVYNNLSYFDRALDYVLRALKLFEELDDKKSIAEAYKNIGNVYLDLKNSKLALTYYLKSLGILEELKENKGIARVLNNIGNIYSKANQSEKALDYYQRSYNIIEKLDWKIGMVPILNNIATVYSETQRPTLALEYNKKALEISKSFGQKRIIAILLSNIGVNYRLMGQYKKALDYVYKALEIAKNIKNKDIIRNFYEELSYIYDAKKDYQQAFFYLKKYKATEDEIFSEESKKNISELWLKFKTEKKEQEIQLLTQNNRTQQFKLDRQKLVRNFLTVVSILILILAVVIFSRFKTKQKTERLLKASEKKLRIMNMSKDKLFSIIAHDLVSPLNGLLLSSSYLEKNYQSMENEEVKELLHQIYENSNHMSKLLENLLQWAMSQLEKLEVISEKLDFRILVKDTIDLLEPYAKEKSIKLTSHINSNTWIQADKRMVETIMRNLVSNAIKYTHTDGEVQVNSRPIKDLLEITVSDNGVGIPEDKICSLFNTGTLNSSKGTSGEKGFGLGLLLCKEFVEKNKGSITLERNKNQQKGTRAIFTLPKPDQNMES